jgi:hypothetical protein
VAKTLRKGSAAERAEREMLRLLARDADVYAGFADRLTEEHFRAQPNRRLFLALKGANGDITSVVDAADQKLAAGAASLTVEPFDGDPSPEYAEAVWRSIHGYFLSARSDALRLKVQKLNPTEDHGYDDLFKQLVDTDAELRRLRESPA